jgi:hypothetical protein
VCAEATALMPNGDTVIIGISVGTFKQGLIGDPAFQGAVIKSGDQLYQVRRLSDLPVILRTPSGIPRALPDLQAGPLRVDMISPMTYPILVSLLTMIIPRRDFCRWMNMVRRRRPRLLRDHSKALDN